MLNYIFYSNIGIKNVTAASPAVRAFSIKIEGQLGGRIFGNRKVTG